MQNPPELRGVACEAQEGRDVLGAFGWVARHGVLASTSRELFAWVGRCDCGHFWFEATHGLAFVGEPPAR